MPEIGGNSQPADSPFAEAATKSAGRAANLGQTAALAVYLRSYFNSGKEKPRRVPQAVLRDQQARRKVDQDLPLVLRYLSGGRDDHGRWQRGTNLEETYQAWLRAAGQARRDPHGSAAWTFLCEQRMAMCPGGPELLRVYRELLWDRVDRVEAMKRAWKQTEPARGFAGQPAARPHQGGAEPPSALAAEIPSSGRLPAPAPAVAERGRPGPKTAAAEAARLLGFPEVTVPELRAFQDRYGRVASRDGSALARQWLADMRRQHRLGAEHHDAWVGQVNDAARSPEHARWRADHGLAEPRKPATEAARAATAAGPGPGQAVADHLAGHAAQHHRVSDRKLGRAVDDPLTAEVNEKDLFRQRAHNERGEAEVYDALAESHAGLRQRAAAARPSPASIHRASPPADLAGKRPPQVVAAQLLPPAAGRGPA